MKKIRDYIDKKRLNIMIAVIFFFVSVIRMTGWYPFSPCRWNEVTLSFGYRYGFIQRGFLGTLVWLMARGSHMSNTTILNLFQLSTIIMMVIVSLAILFRSISKMQALREAKYCVYAWGTMVFVLGFGWDTWFSKNLFAHTDIWLILLTLISAFCVLKKKYISVLLIASICLLIHQAYVFMYLNVIIAAFLLLSIKEKSIEPLKWLGIMLLICSVLFIYLQFFSKAKAGITYEMVRENANSYTGNSYIDFWESQTKTYLFREKDTQSVTQGFQFHWKYIPMEAIFLIPLFVEFVRYWKRIIDVTDDKARRFAYRLAPWGILTTIPLFIMHTDYGRWMFAVYFYEILLVCLMNSINDENTDKKTLEYIEIIKNHPGYYCILAGYVVMLGGMDRSFIRPFYRSVYDLLELFIH